MANNLLGTITCAANYRACPRCTRMYRGEIYMGASGHNVCPDCLDPLPNPKSCPSCRLPFGDKPKRNSALEEEMARSGLIVTKCKNSRWGCFKETWKTEIVAHEKICQYNVLNGPTVQCEEVVSQRSFPSDVTVGSSISSNGHDGIVDFWESDAVVNMSHAVARNEIDSVFHTWQWNGTNFIKKWEAATDGNGSYVWVAAAGDPMKANKYSYELALANDQIEPEYKYKGTVLSLSKKADYVEQTSQGMPLTNDVLFRYKQGTTLSDGQLKYKIQFRVKLHEKTRPLSAMTKTDPTLGGTTDA